MIAVIMAGGKGTRITSMYSDIPKSMIPILGKPILEYQIETLARQGITDIILVVGYLGNVIKDYFKEGVAFGVAISYIEEISPLGTAGALFYLKQKVTSDFLLVNGDLIFDVDIKRLLSFHKLNGGVATIVTHPNSHPYDSGIIESNDNGMVTKWLHKEDERFWYKNRVNSGIHMLSPRIFSLFSELKKIDLDRDILRPMICQHILFAYDTPEYIKDMGTPDRLLNVERDVRNGLVQQKNLLNKQKAIFLDRDGTINKDVGFLRKIDDFELIEGVTQAIKKINQSGFLAIVITNQPVIARGEMSFEELEMVHKKMETLLGREGAFLDDIFFCPHHPDAGFSGERKELKIKCTCRKPAPGLIFRARDKYNIDLSQSYMIGDSKTDEEVAINAGCSPCRIGDPCYKESLSCSSLKDCINIILSKKENL